MKQVLLKKYKIGKKDFLKYFLIGFGHYALMFMFAVVVFSIKLDLTNHIFGIENNVFEAMILYSLIVGPGVNLLLHIWFTELGRPWIRLLMWMHTLLCFSLIATGGLL